MKQARSLAPNGTRTVFVSVARVGAKLSLVATNKFRLAIVGNYP